MSSKRGRKRNDNLPPNRARDVQRAFRARRAAHLQALEQRVSELEDENNYLRQALNLPPANRPLLGKGPTGKDKPKPLDNVASPSDIACEDSPNGDSPTSRTSSLSPCAMTVPMPARSTPVIDGASWDEAILLSDLPPSRNSAASLYLASATQYPASADRASSSVYNGNGYLVRSDIRCEPARQFSTYSHSTFQAAEVDMHGHTPPPVIPVPHPTHRETSMPYPQRRSLTEPQGYSVNQGYAQLNAHPSHLQQNGRSPDYHQLPESIGQLHLHSHPQAHAHQAVRSVFGDGV